MTTTVIPLSKKKILLLVAGSLVFVALGVWLLMLDPDTSNRVRRFNDPVILRGVGIASILFFGLCTAVGVRKLFENVPGLVLSEQGIADRSSALSGGIVPWSEVTDIGEYRIQGQRFVSVFVHDPEKYVDRGNRFQRMANRANLKMVGTPLNISSNSLRIRHDELLRLMLDYFQRSRENQPADR